MQTVDQHAGADRAGAAGADRAVRRRAAAGPGHVPAPRGPGRGSARPCPRGGTRDHDRARRPRRRPTAAAAAASAPPVRRADHVRGVRAGRHPGVRAERARRRHVRVHPAVRQGDGAEPDAARRGDLLRAAARSRWRSPRAAAVARRWARPWRRVIIGVVLFLFVVALLAWADAGQTIPFNVVNLLSGTLNDSIPIMLGALTGVICSTSGVINIAIEGQLLLGAFCAAIATRYRVAVARADLRRARRVAGGRAARRLRDRLPGRPDRARRRAQHPGARPHRLPVQRDHGAVRRHAEQPVDVQPGEDPAARRHPDHRAGVLRLDDVPVPHVRDRSPWSRSGCPGHGGGCGRGPSASTRWRPTPSASGCSPCGTGT